MSTITKRAFMVLPLVFIGWIAVMAIVMRVSDAAPGAVVLFPSFDLMASLPDDAAILGMNPISVTLANRAGLANDLYGSGAWLVLPAGLAGCLPLSGDQRDRLLGRNAE